MPLFYMVWLVLCAGWGYVLASLSTSPKVAVPVSMSGVLGNVALFGALFFAGLWVSHLPSSKAVLSLSVRPWRSWLIALQLVCATFVVAGLFGIAFASAAVGTVTAPAASLLGGAQALVALWLACHAYRRVGRA